MAQSKQIILLDIENALVRHGFFPHKTLLCCRFALKGLGILPFNGFLARGSVEEAGSLARFVIKSDGEQSLVLWFCYALNG